MSFFNAHTFVSVGCLPNLIFHQLQVVLFGLHSMKLTCWVLWGSFLAMAQVQIGKHSFTFDHVYGSTGFPNFFTCHPKTILPIYLHFSISHIHQHSKHKKPIIFLSSLFCSFPPMFSTTEAEPKTQNTNSQKDKSKNTKNDVEC